MFKVKRTKEGIFFMSKKEELENLIKERLGVDEIDRDATIATAGLDSLDVVELLLDLEDRFGVTFTSEETKDLKTFGELFDLILSKIS